MQQRDMVSQHNIETSSQHLDRRLRVFRPVPATLSTNTAVILPVFRRAGEDPCKTCKTCKTSSMQSRNIGTGRSRSRSGW
ncbi:hypothetical protein E4U41_004697 [Claviceps citrina]|nr:hypothetical protein E4U41_004697 [Claviceps citrina]